MTDNTFDFFKRVLIVIGVAVTPVLIWYLFGVVLMAFGAIILAMLLCVGAEPLERWLRLPQWAALVLSGLLIFVVIAGTGSAAATAAPGDRRRRPSNPSGR